MIVIHIDGASFGNPGPSGAGFVVLEHGRPVHRESIPLGYSTNNRAEYQALLAALRWVLTNRPGEEIEIRTDSALLYNQLRGSYRVKDPELARLLESARALLAKVPADVVWMSRQHNLADSWAKKGAALSRAGRNREHER